jgi:hypothetical protein
MAGDLSSVRMHLVAAPNLFAGLLTSLIHQLLMAGQALTHFLKPLTVLLTILLLIFDLVAILSTELFTLFSRACSNFLLLIAKLLLMLFASLGHILYGIRHFCGEALLQPGTILLEVWAARLETIAILLLNALRSVSDRSPCS